MKLKHQCQAVCLIHGSELYGQGKQCNDFETERHNGHWLCWVHRQSPTPRAHMPLEFVAACDANREAT